MKYEVEQFVKNYYENNNLIRVRFNPNRIQRFFGIKQRHVQYIGNGTIWRNFLNFNRCSVQYESWLCDLNTQLEYNASKKPK